MRTKTPLGDYVTTRFQAIGSQTCEHVTLECKEPTLRVVSMESKGRSIYERPVDAWSGTWDVKRIRSRSLKGFT